MVNYLEVKNSIKVLIEFAHCFAWEEFGECGGPCYNPHEFDSLQEEVEAAITVAVVLIAMPKGSSDHICLAKNVAKALGNNYVTYPWLVKSVSRILSGTDYNSLIKAVLFASDYQSKMKQLGL